MNKSVACRQFKLNSIKLFVHGQSALKRQLNSTHFVLRFGQVLPIKCWYPLKSNSMFAHSYLDVWASLCRMTYVRGLTLETRYSSHSSADGGRWMFKFNTGTHEQVWKFGSNGPITFMSMMQNLQNFWNVKYIYTFICAHSFNEWEEVDLIS